MWPRATSLEDTVPVLSSATHFPMLMAVVLALGGTKALPPTGQTEGSVLFLCAQGDRQL